MQPDPRLLGLPFKRGPKLLNLMFSQTHLNLGKFIVIVIFELFSNSFLFLKKKKTQTVPF
jgi:hypothetical protein